MFEMILWSILWPNRYGACDISKPAPPPDGTFLNAVPVIICMPALAIAHFGEREWWPGLALFFLIPMAAILLGLAARRHDLLAAAGTLFFIIAIPGFGIAGALYFIEYSWLLHALAYLWLFAGSASVKSSRA